MQSLERVEIVEKAYVRASNLSGGQRQRVGIARALAQQPQVILADEPVASLDPPTSHVVMRDLQRINRELGITTIVNLHFLDLATAYADRIVGLRAGAVVFDGLRQRGRRHRVRGHLRPQPDGRRHDGQGSRRHMSRGVSVAVEPRPAAAQATSEPVRHRRRLAVVVAHAADRVGLGVRHRLLVARGVREVRQRQPGDLGDPGHRLGPDVLGRAPGPRSWRRCASPSSARRPGSSWRCRWRCGRRGSAHRTRTCARRRARRVTNVIRAFPDILWALLFVAAVGIGALPGLLSLFFFSIAVVTKLTADTLDGIDSGPLEAANASGARHSQMLRTAVVPQILPAYASYSLYAFELNLRASSVIGLVGAGGIGERIQFFVSQNNWEAVWGIVVMFVIVVFIVDRISTLLRRRLV